MNKVLSSSKSDEWSTPDEVYKALNKEFGFTLDAAASKENHKADRYFTKEHDGLMASWGGKPCFAIPHIATSGVGLKRVTENLLNRAQRLLC